MLESRRPRLAADANNHASTGPSRNDTARAATPIASTASPTAVAIAAIGASIGSRSCASTLNKTRTRSAFTAKRRNQPRAVDTGTPDNTATLRCPTPAAFATNATPITPTASRRRNNVSVLISTCVTAQPAHRERRGRRRSTRPRQRTFRHRPNPHDRSRPPHPGQPSAPADKTRSTSSSSVPTINNSAPGHQEGPSRHRSSEEAGGSLRVQCPHPAARTRRRQPNH